MVGFLLPLSNSKAMPCRFFGMWNHEVQGENKGPDIWTLTLKWAEVPGVTGMLERGGEEWYFLGNYDLSQF